VISIAYSRISAKTLQRAHVSTGRAKKRGHRLMTIILSNLHLLKKMSLEDSLVNLQQLNGYHKSHRTLNVTTLPCETLMSAKQTLNDKLQGSVAACLRRGGVVNNQVKKGLLLSLLVKFFF